MIDIRDGEIADILPDQFTRQTQVMAISYALKLEYARYLEAAQKAYVYASIDTAPHDVLDYLAVDLHVRYYRQDYDIEKKRTLIKAAILVGSRDGTKYAVDTVIQTAIGQGRTLDWYEYGGEPGCFRIWAEPENGYDIESMLAVMASVKRESAHLDGITLHTGFDQNIYFGFITETSVMANYGKCIMPDEFEYYLAADDNGTYLTDNSGNGILISGEAE